MTDASPILIIDRGDLPSLAACMLYPDPGRMILWHVQETDAAARQRFRVCEAKAETLAARRLIASRPLDVGLPDLPPPSDLYQAALLLQAAAMARQLRCARIIWSKQVGPDFERMGEIVDRANLVADLAGYADSPSGGGGAGRGGILIDLPLVDLTDEHLVDLIDESGGPRELFWPCEAGNDAPCGACGGCVRWHGAFDAMGLPWPWTMAATA